MQNIFRILMLMLVAALAACGGGGEASGVNPNQATLVTTAGTSLILPVGAARDYQINGGVPPYRINNANEAVAVGRVSGNTLTIGAVAAGTANVNVLDYSGASVTIGVQVGSSVPLYTTAPGSLTIGVGANVARTFWIGGGGAPYTIEGGDSNVALVEMIGATQWKATGVAIGATTVKIRDAAGQEISVGLIVGSPELRISPTDLVMPVGMEAIAKLSGGQPPYRVAGGIPAAITATIQGDELHIQGSLASELEISVMDAAGKTVKVKVTINTSTTSIRLSPSALTVSENDTQPIQFSLFGAKGATCVFTSDPSFLQPTSSGCMIRSTITLDTGTRGSRCVNSNTPITLTVVDADRSIATATVTIADNGNCNNSDTVAGITLSPSALNLNPGAAADVLISGGSGRFDIAVGNTAVATAALMGNTVRITAGTTAGTATVTVRDQVDQSKTATISVTVTGNAATQSLFSTAPADLYIGNGPVRTRTYQITGGTPGAGYTATSANTEVAEASVSGTNLVITATGPGNTKIIVSDRAAPTPATLTINVTVSSSTGFFINAPATVKLALSSSELYAYELAGGSQFPTEPRYRVVSSDTSVATGSVVGTTLRVTPRKVGTTTLQLTDAVGASIALSVEVTTDVAPVTPGTPVVKAPVFQSAKLLDSNQAETNSISASGYTTLAVTLVSPSGSVIPNQLIAVSGDAAQVSFPEGASGLTDSSGVAKIKIKRAALTATGAGSLTVTYSYKSGSLINYYPSSSIQPPTTDTVVSTYVGYQLATADIKLDSLDLGGTGSLAAYGTRQISVQVSLNGAPTPTPVQVNFSATCGQISPATASTNAQGKVTVSYSATDVAGTAQSTQGCSGKTVEISASTLGATVVSKTLNVLGAPATNMGFISATPNRIYLANSGGPTQSLVKFKLVNAQNEPILGRNIVLSLKTVTGAVDATKATFGTVGNITAITTPTDSNGEVSVPVFSGTVPTNVLVNAKLADDATIQTDSAVLTIASGRPAQARVSLAIEKFSIEGFNVDGDESTVTMSLADRQGNPVPDGTAVNFVTEGGVMIPPVCTTGTNAAGNSQCTVKIRSQNPRPQATSPRIGRVSILAYSAGEEDFVDANFNNVYNAGEAFTDLGTAYRDDNESGSFDTGEFSVPRTGTIPSRGDGVWGATDVRGQHIIIFATSGAVITPGNVTTAGVGFSVADEHGNSMPTGSVITVKAVDNTENQLACTVAAGGTAVIPNTLDPFTWSVSLSKCAVGDSVTIEIKTPKTSTVTGLTVPLR